MIFPLLPMVEPLQEHRLLFWICMICTAANPIHKVKDKFEEIPTFEQFDKLVVLHWLAERLTHCIVNKHSCFAYNKTDYY